MILIDRTETDPYFNIAAEEYVLKQFDKDAFMFWVNPPAIIIGKHQVAAAEADIIYSFNNDIPVIRRISGGGTVYHDEGNLNYSLISRGERGKLVDYKKYSGTVIRALATQSVVASLMGKSSLAVNGRKFSGNAEHVYRNRVLHHGTMLFNTDLKILRKCLRPEHPDYQDRSIRSTDSSIANLSEYLHKSVSMQDFGAILIRQVKKDFPGIVDYSFSDHDKKMIRKLVRTKYSGIEWNFSYSPKYELRKMFRIGNEEIKLELHTEKGHIKDMSLHSDGYKVMEEISRGLINILHHPAAIKDALLNVNFTTYPELVNPDELINGLF